MQNVKGNMLKVRKMTKTAAYKKLKKKTSKETRAESLNTKTKTDQ